MHNADIKNSQPSAAPAGNSFRLRRRVGPQYNLHRFLIENAAAVGKCLTLSPHENDLALIKRTISEITRNVFVLAAYEHQLSAERKRQIRLGHSPDEYITPPNFTPPGSGPDAPGSWPVYINAQLILDKILRAPSP